MRSIARVALLAGFFSSSSLAQQIDIPVTNWTVPPYTRSSSGGITTMTDATPPRVFIGVRPCRIVDTRVEFGFPPGFGQPGLSPGVQRSFDLDNGPCPGLPAGIDAYSLNVTVVNPAGPGHLVIFPTGGSQPDVSSINYTAGQTIANAVIVPAGTDGKVTVVAGVSGTNLLIDINGYFAERLGNANASLDLTNNSYSSTISATNTNTDGGFALSGYTYGGTAVSGLQSSTSAAHIVYGVQGGNNSQHFYSAGVHGGGYYKGVDGQSNGLGNAAGVFGTHQGCCTSGSVQTYNAAGVRGDGLVGVLGLSTVQGVAGSLVSSGVEVTWGALGHNIDADPTCIAGDCAPPWGVFSGGSIGAFGTKHFLDPHPRDPKLAISYVSLEGPEAGTYFRGRAKFQNGIARIPVPEHFRLVTDPEGLTVQVTPIGAMASVAVLRMDLDEIVVQSSRNVEFSYLVQGVRATFKDLSPVRAAGDFMPRRADATLPLWLSPAQRRLLIQNGTYREDGTVNMETAHRLGWDKVWEKRSQPAPQPSEP
jgi:hypothetical protein